MNKKIACIGFISICSMLTLSGCFAPLLIVGAAGAGTATVAGSSLPISTQISDTSIKTKIIAILNNMNDQLEYRSNVEVTVFNGVVLLLGQVPSQPIKNSIASQTSQIKGVKLVYNQLTVGPKVDLGTYSDDAWITAKVKANMIGQVDPLHFKVVTQKGVVYLLGQITKQEGNIAVQVANQVPGVKKVIPVFTYIAAPVQAPPSDVSTQNTDSVQAGAISDSNAPTPNSGGDDEVGPDASD